MGNKMIRTCLATLAILLTALPVAAQDAASGAPPAPRPIEAPPPEAPPNAAPPQATGTPKARPGPRPADLAPIEANAPPAPAPAPPPEKPSDANTLIDDPAAKPPTLQAPSAQTQGSAPPIATSPSLQTSPQTAGTATPTGTAAPWPPAGAPAEALSYGALPPGDATAPASAPLYLPANPQADMQADIGASDPALTPAPTSAADTAPPAQPAAPLPPPVHETLREDDFSYSACLLELTMLGADFTEESAITDPDTRDCGIDRPIMVHQPLPGIAITGGALMRCDTARHLAHWLRDFVKPASASLPGQPKLTTLEPGTTYQCRATIGTSGENLSEHAFGNALDIAAFGFETGPRVVIEPRDDTGDMTEAFQRAVRSTACLHFTTVLGPGANAAHDDHLHLDIKARKNGWRLCQ